jgi:hypothetical protein
MSVILPAAEVPGAAQETTSTAILAAVDGLESDLATLAAVDFATEATATGIANALTTLATEATATGIAASLTTLAAEDFATEATLAKTRKWPYATFDAQVLTAATGTDTWQYKTGGATGTTVGTILITYSDATKSVISNITYTPAKAV